jgi:hypothetical protein
MLDFEEASSFALTIETVSAVLYSGTLTIQGATKAGVFKYAAKIVPGTFVQSFTFPIADIPIFVSVIQDDVTTGPNNIWAVLKLTINKDVAMILTQGYPSDNSSISWPSQQPINNVSERGAKSTLTGMPAGAGLNWSDTVGVNQFHELLSVRIVFQTGVAVVNRRPALKIVSNGQTRMLIPSAADIPASQIIDLNWIKGAQNLNDATGLRQTMPLCDNLLLGNGDIIGTDITNIQPGDAINEIYLLENVFYF